MRIAPTSLAALLALVFCARAGAAGGTASDQAVSLTYGSGHWSSSPTADLLGVDSAGDVLRASGWWYRAEGDTREYPLPPPDTETYTKGYVHAVWNNLDQKGFRLEENTWVFDHENPSGGFFTQMWTQNIGASPKQFTLFHYVDVALDGTDLGDSAVLIAPKVIQLTDGASRAVYRSDTAWHLKVASLPGISTLLDDSGVTTLDDGGLPYGPGNATAAFQMPTLQVLPGSRVQSLVSFFVNLPKDHVKGDLVGGLPFPPLVAQHTGLTSPPYVSMMRRTEQLAQFPFVATPGNAILGVDDFTGEGLKDQPLYRKASTGELLIGDTPVSGAPTPGLDWRFSATGDFDGDAKADIVWRNLSTLKIVIWTMNGAQKTGEIVPSPAQAPSYDWTLAAAADFDGDGLRDFLWFNQRTAVSVIWYMDENLVRKSGVFTQPTSIGSTSWRPVAVGDYGLGLAQGGTPKLGTQDIVWQNDTSKNIVIWHMDHAAHRTSGVFSQPATLLPGYVVAGPR